MTASPLALVLAILLVIAFCTMLFTKHGRTIFDVVIFLILLLLLLAGTIVT